MTVNGREFTKVNGKFYYKDEYELYTGWLAGVKGKTAFARDNESLKLVYWKGYKKGKEYAACVKAEGKEGPENIYFMIEPKEIDPETEEFVVV